MLIGVPTEIKAQEYRVALTPGGARELIARGHRVLLQQGAGEGSGFADDEYLSVGVTLKPTAAAVFAEADLIVKVKEPQAEEVALLRPGQLLFTYLHLAANRSLAEGLLASGAVALAYETVVDAAGRLPLLAPMSEVAGRLATLAGAYHLQRSQGGRGVLLGGVPGVAPGRVLVLGGGVVGTQAARMALGLGADVSVLDKSLPRLRELDSEFGGRLKTRFATEDAIEALLCEADLVVGAVLIPGARTPRLVSRRQLKCMKPASVLVDVAIDQGGCFETSRPTTHQQPTFIEQGVLHYCVANMPSAAARTSTQALVHATLPYIGEIADKGAERALIENTGLAASLTVCAGALTQPAVAASLCMDVTSIEDALRSV